MAQHAISKFALIFTRNQRCEYRGLLRVFGTLRLTGDIFERILWLSKMGFCCFKLKKKWLSSLMRIPSGIFWHCKFDEILIVSFCIFKKIHLGCSRLVMIFAFMLFTAESSFLIIFSIISMCNFLEIFPNQGVYYDK